MNKPANKLGIKVTDIPRFKQFRHNKLKQNTNHKLVRKNINTIQ